AAGGLARRLELVDRDLLGLDRHLLPAPRQLVELDPVYLLRRVRRRLLLDGADEAVHGARDLLAGEALDGPGRGFAQHLAGSVVGVGDHAETDHPVVDLRRPDQEPRQPRGGAQRQQQQPGRVRVESAAVPDPLLPKQPAHPLHHIVRGKPGLLVDQQQPVFHPTGFPATCFSPPVAAVVAAADSSSCSAWPAVAGAVAPASPPIAAAAGSAGVPAVSLPAAPAGAAAEVPFAAGEEAASAGEEVADARASGGKAAGTPDT